MESSTAKEEYKNSIQDLFCTAVSSGKHWMFFSAINFFFSITAILGNTLILIALHKESSLHPPSKLLYRCLAITDLLVGLISEPSAALYYAFLVTKHGLDNRCFIPTAISTVSFTTLSAVSLLTMTVISVDRLLALLSGLRYRHIVTLRRVRALVIFFWIPSVIFASMSSWKFKITKIFNYTVIVLCIFISTFCYSKIFHTLRQHQTQVRQHQEQSNAGRISLNLARYRKTVSTAMWVEVTLLACYLPYSVVIAIVTIHGPSPFLHIIWKITWTVLYLNSSLNPFLYCLKIREVRQEVKKTIRQFLCL
ncbi:hypothetical protein ACROYT_G033526 [Oculina patagonica]